MLGAYALSFFIGGMRKFGYTSIMNDCIFCNIAAHEIPAHIVYEDNSFIAFLDIHPRAPGHVQVIPKHHYRWVWDVPNAGDYFTVVQTIARAQQRAFGIELIRSQIYGEEIPHAHIWIWPDIPHDGTEQDFPAIAERIRRAL